MDIRHVNDPECISCGECVEVCPTNAIVWKGPKLFIKANEGQTEDSKQKNRRLATRCISAVLILSVLFGAIGYYWSEGGDVLPPQGSEVGDLCYSNQLEILTPEGISENKIDPTKTGKITVVNFWGTWCTPCVNELPYFDQIAHDYADTVAVIAVHTNMIHETAPEFIGKYYPNSKITFAKDYTENGIEGYYTALGGRDTYPYTVVLDEQGVILAVFFEALEYEDLQQVIEDHLK
jgi:thiol-disulfide isomerase/thioredoxin